MKTKKIDLKCFCGDFKAKLKIVSPNRAFRIHCLCSDCQKFAKYLKCEDTILDKHGGTELFQTYPKYIEVVEGHDKISSLQLKENSIIRWHTSCCNAPIANTMNSARMPFAGVFINQMSFPSEEEKINSLGPLVMKAFGRSAIGEKPEDAHDSFPKMFIFKVMKFMLRGFLTAKHKPSPFFLDKVPVAKPKVLNKKIVTQKYEIDYTDPIDLKVGEEIQILDKDNPEKWRGWHYCKDSTGKEGWISETYFENKDNKAIIIKDYIAKEISVELGEEIKIVFEDCGWAWCKKPNKQEGWLPMEIFD